MRKVPIKVITRLDRIYQTVPYIIDVQSGDSYTVNYVASRQDYTKGVNAGNIKYRCFISDADIEVLYEAGLDRWWLIAENE